MALHKEDHWMEVTLKAQGQESMGSIVIRHWSHERAKKRGLRFCAAVYAMGILSNINPALHLFLPPIWVIIGPYVGYKIYKSFADTTEMRYGRGACPNCRLTTKIVPYGLTWPFSAACHQCGEAFTGWPTAVDARLPTPAFHSPLTAAKET